MFVIGDLVTIEHSLNPYVVSLRDQYGVGPHKVEDIYDGYLRVGLSSNFQPWLAPGLVEKIWGASDDSISIKQAYTDNKNLDFCCRCGKSTIRIRIGAGFQFCPCTDPSWKGSWPT